MPPGCPVTRTDKSGQAQLSKVLIAFATGIPYTNHRDLLQILRRVADDDSRSFSEAGYGFSG